MCACSGLASSAHRTCFPSSNTGSSLDAVSAPFAWRHICAGNDVTLHLPVASMRTLRVNVHRTREPGQGREQPLALAAALDVGGEARTHAVPASGCIINRTCRAASASASLLGLCARSAASRSFYARHRVGRCDERTARSLCLHTFVLSLKHYALDDSVLRAGDRAACPALTC